MVGIEHVPEGQKHAGNVIFRNATAEKEFCRKYRYTREYSPDDE
jgi:hypothetical protein